MRDKSFYNQPGGYISNSHYSLLFSSGIPLKTVPLRRRFAQTATTCINPKNMEYQCLWAVPNKDSSSRGKISFPCLTSCPWSTPCLWSQQTLVNTVITARPLSQRCSPHPWRRTAWTPLALPLNCPQWRAPASRSDCAPTHFYRNIAECCRVFIFLYSDIWEVFLCIWVWSQPHPWCTCKRWVPRGNSIV